MLSHFHTTIDRLMNMDCVAGRTDFFLPLVIFMDEITSLLPPYFCLFRLQYFLLYLDARAVAAILYDYLRDWILFSVSFRKGTLLVTLIRPVLITNALLPLMALTKLPCISEQWGRFSFSRKTWVEGFLLKNGFSLKGKAGLPKNPRAARSECWGSKRLITVIF